MICYYKLINSVVGKLKLVAGDNELVAILWEHDDLKRVPFALLKKDEHHSILLEAEHQLNAYFAKTLQHFTLPLKFNGTEFQKKVWNALTTIPFGQTRSYLQIANQIGHPKAVRAVGAANGRNPISIIVPCHRVIGTNGKLTGFAGGLKAKALLLGIEAD